MAWAWVDKQVVIESVDVPGDGRFYLGYRASDLGGGTWTYEYALQNLNSVRSVGSFAVGVPAGVSVTAPGFHDVDYHSGEPYALTDWTATVTSDKISWATQTYAQNQLANALRWGTLYNFRFDANAEPEPEQVDSAFLTIVFFKPSGAGPPGPSSERVLGQGPGIVIPPCPTSCPTDVNTDGVTNVLDLIDLLLCFGQPDTPPCDTGQDINCDTAVNVLDLIDLLLEFGTACP